jgi:hypothetical protein
MQRKTSRPDRGVARLGEMALFYLLILEGTCDVFGRLRQLSYMASMSSSRRAYRSPGWTEASLEGRPLLVRNISRGRPSRSTLGATPQRFGCVSVSPPFSLKFVSIRLSMQKLWRRTHAVIIADLRRNFISRGRQKIPQRRTKIPVQEDDISW